MITEIPGDYPAILLRRETKRMKKRKWIPILLALCLLLGCTPAQTEDPAATDVPVWLNLNTTFPQPRSLDIAEGEPVKVILLLGQSNATGCGLNSYLEKNLGTERYSIYEAGFPSVLINYCLDDHKTTSGGEFVPVDLTCGATDGYFGPEVGLAEILAGEYPDENVVILKYTMSGYSLHHHWLCMGDRGSIYKACQDFTRTYMDALLSAGCDARIGAVCWMQGESDTTDYKASLYFDNQTKFVSYLREDLAPYAEEGGIAFIDAGISNSPYCEPAYPTINEAKLQFSKTSPLNYYFSTIEHGLTVHQEPPGDPDWGHYDSVSGITLGRLFGDTIVKSYRDRET